MKKSYFLLLISILAFTICNMNISLAQDTTPTDDYSIINGTVKEKKSGKRVGYVNISLSDSNIGTMTNADGEFSLKIKSTDKNVNLLASCMGYKNSRVNVQVPQNAELTIYLKPDEFLLDEIKVYPNDPRSIVEIAMRKIDINYPEYETMLTGFYREVTEKGHGCINVSEAILETYKTAYSNSIDNDKARIIKGRKLISPRKNDTILVKLMGGPALAVNLDAVKNRNGILCLDEIPLYNYNMGSPESTDGRMQYVISFSPRMEMLDKPQYYGKLYIDKETLAFSRAEISLSMADPCKATKEILRKKPAGLKFKPLEQSFTVTYSYNGGISYLSYIKSTIRFKCNWEKRLFSNNYSIISEIVVTDYQKENIKSFPAKMAFGENDILYDRLANFEDTDFWEQYNILEPTESLEHSINKLIKKMK